MEEVAKLLGLGQPFVFAAAIFGLFKYLDSRASEDAKQAISSWLRPIDFDRPALGAALVEIFDRIYAFPLLSWRAFFRSAAISVAAVGLWMPFLFTGYYLYINQIRFPELQTFAWMTFLVLLLFNVFADYLSLLVVRKWLERSGGLPIVSLLVGPLIAVAVIAALLLVRYSCVGYLHEVIGEGIIAGGDWFDFATFWEHLGEILHRVWVHATRGDIFGDLFFYPALVAHVWMPLFLIAVAVVRGANSVVRLTQTTQWFLDKGKDHPLEAIGWVSTGIVFVFAGVVHLAK